MDNPQLGSASPAGQSASVARSGRVKRVVTTIAAGSDPAWRRRRSRRGADLRRVSGDDPHNEGHCGTPAGKCAKLVHNLRSHPAVASSHPALVMRLRAFCGNPLLRLAAVGGEYGQVTFKGKTRHEDRRLRARDR